MTPQQASELLDGDFKTETHPEWVGAVQADFDSFSGAYIRATPGHEALYEAAQELAETVSGLRYEYAIQVKRENGPWMYLRELSELYGDFTPNPSNAMWMDLEGATEEAGTWAEARIVRRLVSGPEVFE